MSKSISTKSFTAVLLAEIAADVDVLFYPRYEYRLFFREGFTGWRNLHERTRRQYIKRALKLLKQKRLIKEQKIGKKVSLFLTNKGKISLLAKKIQEAPLWENSQKTIVVFDIPESTRDTRDSFRRFLRANTFLKIQQSVWETDKACAADLLQYVHAASLSKWVKIIIGSNVQ